MLIVMCTTNIPEHLRGYVGRFLSEARPGVYVGTTSRRVAADLWDRVTSALKDGDALMITPSTQHEQGYQLHVAGQNSPRIVSLDGLQLISKPADPQVS